MNPDELCRKLNISREQLTQLIDGGLPWTGTAAAMKFDESDVIRWLLQNNLASPPDDFCIVQTLREAADFIGRPMKTLNRWICTMGCPGQPGAYDVQAIRAWMKEAAERDDIRSDGRSGSKYLDELREHRLGQIRETLIRKDEVAREAERQKQCIESVLSLLADKVVQRLPSNLDVAVVDVIRQVADDTATQCCSPMEMSDGLTMTAADSSQ